MTGGLLQLSGIVVDIVHSLDRVPKAGEEVEALGVSVTAGGGFNAMVAARRFGIGVTYGGLLGTGTFAEIAADHLAGTGIPSAIARRSPLDQGTCVVLVDRDGERTFISRHGAERQFETADMEHLDARDFSWLLLTGYSVYKAESAAVLLPWIEKKPADLPFLFDPGPTVADIPQDRLKSVLRQASWISANQQEAEVLASEPDPSRAASKLARERCGAIVRCGEAGAWAASENSAAVFFPAFTVRAVDTNGAGDAHAGAFIASLALGYSWQQAVTLANAAAAIATTRPGPAAAPCLEETLAFIQSRDPAAANSPILKKDNQQEELA